MKPYFIHFDIKEAHLPYISPVMGGMQQCECSYSYGPVMRRYYIIEYVISGCGEYIVKGHSYRVSAGEAFIIRPHEPHLLRADKDDPWQYVWVGFSTELELPKELSCRYVFDGTPAADIFSLLADGNHSQRKAVDYACALYAIFARYYSMNSESDKQSTDPIDTAISIIKKEYATISVSELASRLYMNRSYFGSRFKERVGVSPKQYIDQTRLSVAAMMMTELGYTATQAALATGYSDTMSFSRMYKKHYGKPPRNSIANRSVHGGTIILK